jgi:hypothetical protein
MNAVRDPDPFAGPLKLCGRRERVIDGAGANRLTVDVDRVRAAITWTLASATANGAAG